MNKFGYTNGLNFLEVFVQSSIRGFKLVKEDLQGLKLHVYFYLGYDSYCNGILTRVTLY